MYGEPWLSVLPLIILEISSKNMPTIVIKSAEENTKRNYLNYVDFMIGPEDLLKIAIKKFSRSYIQ